MVKRTLVALLLAVLLIGCGGGSSSSPPPPPPPPPGDNGGVNGTYSGSFTPTTPAGLQPFTITAHFTQAAAAGSPITGTATFTSPMAGSPPACLGPAGTTTLTVSGAEATGGGLNMALINGPDGNSPKIDLPAKGAASTAFADAAATDQSFSGPFSVENCPTTGSPTAMTGTGTLTRTGP